MFPRGAILLISIRQTTKEPGKVPFFHLSKKNLAEVRVYRVARCTVSMLNTINTSFQRQNTDDLASV